MTGWCSNGSELSFSETERFAIVSSRTAKWQGIQQDITGRIERSVPYDVTATVRLRGLNGDAPVLATLRIEDTDGTEQYIGLGR